MSNDNKIVALYDGDQRLHALYSALIEAIQTRGAPLPILSVVGALELAKAYYISKLDTTPDTMSKRDQRRALEKKLKELRKKYKKEVDDKKRC